MYDIHKAANQKARGQVHKWAMENHLTLWKVWPLPKRRKSMESVRAKNVSTPATLGIKN
jgi:hypothetical protein